MAAKDERDNIAEALDRVAGVELADFVGALRDQIRQAQADADPNLPIEVGPTTLESR